MAASNLNFIIAAYAVTWVVLLGYQWRLVRKGRHARAEYERMAQQRSGETGQ
ncbi:MAG: CcmD family protein [Gemmatimonadota bacterium]|nr:CcmD family protein [Gemmatimonadota bacterium]